jgi:hypothetical protein
MPILAPLDSLLYGPLELLPPDVVVWVGGDVALVLWLVVLVCEAALEDEELAVFG